MYNTALVSGTQHVIQHLSFSSVQPLSGARLFAAPWAAARQASPPIPAPGVYSDSVHRVGDATASASSQRL